MSDYYLGVDRDGNIIMHSKGVWKKHKYIQKIGEGANAVYKYNNKDRVSASRNYIDAEENYKNKLEETTVLRDRADMSTAVYNYAKEHGDNLNSKVTTYLYDKNGKHTGTREGTIAKDYAQDVGKYASASRDAGRAQANAVSAKAHLNNVNKNITSSTVSKSSNLIEKGKNLLSKILKK